MSQKPITYKIEDKIPVQNGTWFDATTPEYLTMKMLKVGQSFEFPAARVRIVSNSKLHLIRENPNLAFTHTGETRIQNHKLKTGRCWRLEDGSTRKHGIKNKKK
jgi:hypothetical protein